MSTSRLGLRFFQNTRAAFRNNGASPFRRGQAFRFQSADAGAASAEQQSTFQRLWNSPVGVKTVHFWAPVMKWGLVIAGVSDFSRPAEKLSLTQNGALMATGAIWTRWCMIITPRNMLLAAVNFFLGCVGVVQVSRIFMYRREQAGSSKDAALSMEHEVTDSAKSLAHETAHETKDVAKKST